jgi:hypothetical protein
MPRIDPNLAIGALAARELQARGPRAGERLVCPEPDILAAYADDGLSGEEQDTLEAHLATCASCRRMLAVLVPAGEPRAEPAAILRPVFRVDWKWLSMAAMVVLAAGLWYVVQTDLRSPVLQEARSRTAETTAPGAAAAPAAAPRANALPAQPATGVVGGAAGSASSAVANRPRPAVPVEGVSAIAAAPSSLRDAPSSDEAKEAAKQSDSRAHAELRQQQEKLEKRSDPTAVTVAQQAPATSPSQASGPSQAQMPASPQTAANELARARSAEEVARRREAEQRLQASAPAPAPPPATVTAEGQRAGSVAQDKASVTERDRPAAAAFQTIRGAVTGFTDPQRRVLWRIAGGDRIETSNDGTTWTERHREPAGGLGVGTAPSTGVAWVAGARGLVLRYVAPGPWTRVAKPTDDTIVSISASSAEVARVRTASGLQFETRDAGTTWTPVP